MTIQNALSQQLQIYARMSKFTDEVISKVMARQEATATVPDGTKLYWKTPEDNKRIADYELHRDLYFNDHEALQPKWLPDGRTEYKKYNYCRMVSDTYADIIAGKGSEISTGHNLADKWLKDQQIADKFHTWLITSSYAGMFGLQVVADDEGVELLLVEPQMLFPVFDASGEDYESISKKFAVDPKEVYDPTMRWQWDRTNYEEGVNQIIFEEQHYKDHIKYWLYVTEGDEIKELLPPAWYDPTLPALIDGFSQVETGMDDFMLMIIPNRLVSKRFISDYVDILSFQSSINARGTQIHRILNIHANPKLLLPESMMQHDPQTGKVVARGLRDEVLYISPEDNHIMKPEYLTWAAELEAAYKEQQEDINAICTFSRVSSSLITRSDTQYPEAAVTYRMRLTPTINASAPKKRSFIKNVTRILYIYLLKLQEVGTFEAASTEGVDPSAPIMNNAMNKQVPNEVDQPVLNSMTFKREEINITMKAALPQDDKFLVERVGTGVQTASRKRVLSDVDGMNEDQIAEELAAIEEDTQSDNEALGSTMDGLGYQLPAKPDGEIGAGGLNIGDSPGRERLTAGIGSNLG